MSLALKPTHAPIKAYYETLGQFGQLHIDHEMAVRSAFQDLLAKSGRKANRQRFGALAINAIPPLDIAFEKNQCFPFYTYAEDGTNRHENITDWALEQFRARYLDPSVSKWDIFHYIYAVLHHSEYRERYDANLRRELPRIPFVGSDATSPSANSSPENTVKSQRIYRGTVSTGARCGNPF
jgi:predicted helicase